MNQNKIIIGLMLVIISSCHSPILEKPSQSQEPIKPVAVVENPLSFGQLTDSQVKIIGEKIWMNEGAMKEEYLTAWNEGEEFASLGIGHFIWYPADEQVSFDERFPALLQFFTQQGVELPQWLQADNPDCPWDTRDAFYQAIESEQMKELRQLLKETIPQQVRFIIQRSQQALPKMMAELTSAEKKAWVKEQFYRVAQLPNGVYALIDYVNFKGEGTSPTERYQGKGWGLLQVLMNMSGETDDAVSEFVKAAEFVLKRRIDNSPPERKESRWLPGWQARLKTYTFQME